MKLLRTWNRPVDDDFLDLVEPPAATPLECCPGATEDGATGGSTSHPFSDRGSQPSKAILATPRKTRRHTLFRPATPQTAEATD